jgi:SSS family solute:Na+ symporter
MQYNTATPHLIGNHLPEGMLGLAVTGLLAAFMAGVAVNVTAFNTVVSYDLIQAYFAKDRDSAYYLRAGLLVTIGGILISVATALIAKGYSNIMNYIQTLFSIFNAPLLVTQPRTESELRGLVWGLTRDAEPEEHGDVRANCGGARRSYSAASPWSWL